MASRYYLTSRSPGVDYRAPIHGPWDDTQWGSRFHGRRNWNWLLSTSKVDGGARRGVSGAPTWNVGETNDTPDWDAMFARWITPPLEAQTISGTFDLLLCSAITDDGSDAVWRVYIYITVGDTDAVRHVLLDYVDTGNLWTIFRVGRALASAQSLTAGDAEAGDHVVVELGVRFLNADPADDVLVFDTIAALEFGTTNGTAGAPLADAVLGANGGAGFFDFSHTFVEQAAPAAPAHDACADAKVIAALPYSDGPIDTTQSADTNRAVWYTWTADSAVPVIVRVWGSNYRAQIDVFAGTCGSLGFSIGGDARAQWIQGAQAVVRFTPTPGSTYLIRIQSATSTVECARNSGGELHLTLTRQSTAPQADDLYVNCQHFTAWRDGVLVNFNSGFYGLTPTGAAIDYTQRPIDDFNGGVHTGHRLVVVLFDFNLIEFLDLATLNPPPDSEVTFIEMDEAPTDPVPNDSHPSSLVFDLAGDIVVGFFGDGYDVIGTLSSPDTARARRFDPIFNTNTTPEVSQTAVYPVEQDVMGSDYVEIASDQRTLFYTSAGMRVLRFDMEAEAQLADYALVPTAPGPRPGTRGGRLLPPGDGSGGMLVTNGSEVVRLDVDGNVIQTYAPAASERAQDLDKVELTQDGTQFWVSDQLSASLFKFDLASGAELADIDTQMPAGQLSGFAIYQGFRAGLEEPPPSEPPAPPVPPDDQIVQACPIPGPTEVGSSGCPSPVAFFP